MRQYFSQLCLSDGRLKTAASYLIIIQNLEAASVSRHVSKQMWPFLYHISPLPFIITSIVLQLASQLLDAALDNNYWEVNRRERERE